MTTHLPRIASLPTLRSTWLPALAGALLAVALSGCGSTVDSSGSGGSGGSGECEGADCPQCEAYPTCPEGSVETAECPDGVTCTEASICGTTILCAPEAQCAAEPTCEPDEVEVPECALDADCRPVTMCGSTIYCALTVQCDAVPVCDPGDMEVADGACFDGMVCYESSTCGTTIVCDDSALPQHGCPATEPAPLQDSCAGGPTTCDYPTSPGCFRSFLCDPNSGTWSEPAEACAGG